MVVYTELKAATSYDFPLEDTEGISETICWSESRRSIRNTVINFSNALLQSSVNSFGSTTMAGYTAANNIFGFLYVSVNAITQACMSFTSQNYGLRKLKRMDKILMDCLILTVVVSLVLGGGVYLFGAEILRLYTEKVKWVRFNSIEIFAYTTADIFHMRNYGVFSVGTREQNNDLIRCWYKWGIRQYGYSSCSRLTVRWHFCLFHIRHHGSFQLRCKLFALFCEEKSAWVTVGYAKNLRNRITDSE